MVEPVKSWFMAASAMHFIALVDSQVGSLAGELDDSVSFLCTYFAASGSESFHAREWVARIDVMCQTLAMSNNSLISKLGGTASSNNRILCVSGKSDMRVWP